MFQKHPGSMSLAMVGAMIVYYMSMNLVIGILSFFIIFAFFSTYSERTKK